MEQERDVAVQRRRKWSEAVAKERLEAWRESGMSLAAFARTEGVPVQRLSWWRKRLNEVGAAKKERKRTLVPAVVTTPPSAASETRGPIVIHLAAGSIEITDPDRAMPVWVATLVSELNRR